MFPDGDALTATQKLGVFIRNNMKKDAADYLISTLHKHPYQGKALVYLLA